MAVIGCQSGFNATGKSTLASAERRKKERDLPVGRSSFCEREACYGPGAQGKSEVGGGLLSSLFLMGILE